MLEFKLTTDVHDFEPFLRGKAAALEAGFIRKLDFLNAKLQQRIAGEKLQGQVLNAITGKLARSVEAIPATLSGTLIEGSVQAGGGVAFYGRFHEEGTRGPYEILPKKGKVLAFMLGGKMRFAKRIMHPGLPQRSFVRSAFEEMQTEIIVGLEQVPSEVARS